MSTPILLVGCGKMGEALLAGWLKQGIPASHITVIEPSQHIAIACKYGVATFSSYDQMQQNQAENSHKTYALVLAVKPQILDVVLPTYAENTQIAWYVSIAAGKTLTYYQKYLGTSCGIIRAMPNLGATLGEGVTGLCANIQVTSEQCAETEALFRAVGICLWVKEESDMDSITALSGSGPAYVFYFMECLREIAQEMGLAPEIAHQLALSTVYGSACVARYSEADISDLRKAVTSPKGTTEAALMLLQSEHKGLKPVLRDAIYAAKRRAQEIR